MTWPVQILTREVRYDAEKPEGDREKFAASLYLWNTD